MASRAEILTRTGCIVTIDLEYANAEMKRLSDDHYRKQARLLRIMAALLGFAGGDLALLNLLVYSSIDLYEMAGAVAAVVGAIALLGLAHYLVRPATPSATPTN
jgi:hypothetical protein